MGLTSDDRVERVVTEQTGKIAEALAAFQAEMPVIPKAHTAKVPTKAGGSYSYTYAGLADVTAAAAPLLSKNGLAFSTTPRRSEYGLELVGHLLHISGEALEGALPIGGGTPQEIGSAITYARRYLLGAMTGVVTDDDDDGALAQQSKRAPAQRSTPRPAPAPESSASAREGISPEQLKKLHTMLSKQGITDRADGLAFYQTVLDRDVESSKTLSKAEANKIIDALERAERDDAGPDEPPLDGDPA